MIQMNDIILRQKKLVEETEGGVYSNNMLSHHVPARVKPFLPNKDSHQLLFQAISKQKVH